MKITIEHIRQAAIASKKATPRPVRLDLTGKDFKWENPLQKGFTIRFIVQGRCMNQGMGHLWICRPTDAHDSSRDIYLSKEDIEAAVGEKFAESAIYVKEFSGRTYC